MHRLAESLGLPVLTPRSLRTEEAADAFRAHGADVAVVVAYGAILPPAILGAPRLGCLNLHASLLPRWRGAAPIQRAVMAGDRETGVAVMRMEEGLDTGPVAMVERIPIGPDDTAGEVHDRLMGLGADLMARALAALERGSLAFRPQPEDGVTYARKIANDEARIDWSRGGPGGARPGARPLPRPRRLLRRSANASGSRFCARPSPKAPARRATLLDGDGTVACGAGAVRLLQVRPAGKPTMTAAEFLRGRRLAAGARLS